MMITYSTVTKPGFGRGKTLGFPTINMEIPDVLLNEKRGIYAARVTFGGLTYDAALYFGPPITFGVTTEQLEVYLLEVEVPLATPHKTPITCTHVAFIRDIAMFKDAEALTQQMRADVASVKTTLLH